MLRDWYYSRYCVDTHPVVEDLGAQGQLDFVAGDLVARTVVKADIKSWLIWESWLLN